MINLQFITHETARYSYADSAHMALEGGCKWIQLRMKGASKEDIIAVSQIVEPMCRKHQAAFIIDDHVELVKEIHADGVHLGQLDMRVDEARRILGNDYIIGGTANTFEEVELHWERGCDYVGCGPYRFTTTKKNLAPVLGFSGYEQILACMEKKNIRIPLIAIGGIKEDDILPLLNAGIGGIALSSTVLQAENPIEEMNRIMNIVLSNKNLNK